MISAQTIQQAAAKLDALPIPTKGRVIYAFNTQWMTCNKCEELKPLSEFYKDERSRGGYQHQCRDCQKERRIRAQNKVNEARKLKRAELKCIRKAIPTDKVRTCGFYNPADKVIFYEEDLLNVCNLWAKVIETAREEKNEHFFNQKDGVFAWLKVHMGCE